MELSKVTRSELEQALEAATPRPWVFNFEEGDDYTTIRAGEFEVADTWFCPEMPANARLIVEAVNNLPKLLKVAEAAEEVVIAEDAGFEAVNNGGDLTLATERMTDAVEDLRKALEAIK